MTQINLNTKLMTDMQLVEPLTSRSGVSVYTVRSERSGQLYVLKHISIPENQNQVEALILTGAAADRDAAQAYYEQVVTDYKEELEQLESLSASECLSCFRSYEIKPKEDEVGFDIYLLADHRITLENHLANSVISHADAVGLAIDLCNALIDLRDAGLIHRDVKPANIYRNGQGHFTLGDLGIAKLDGLKYCSMPELMISPYSAPELFELMASVNETVDLYSVGLILYRVYNGGHAPFEDEKTSAKGADKLRITGQELPAPMFADYEVAEIIRKACAFKPEDRYQTPQEMKQAFVDYMMRNQVGDEPITPPIVADDVPVAAEAVEEVIEPVQFASTEDMDETFKKSFSPDSDMLNALIESVHNDIDNDYTAQDEDNTAVSTDTAPARKRSGFTKWFPTVLLIVATVAILATAVWYFFIRKDTLTIDSVEITDRTVDSITISLETNEDPETFHVICTDAYGNISRQEYVPGQLNTFTGLASGAQYVFSVEGMKEEHVSGAVPCNASTKAVTQIINLSISRQTVSEIELTFIPDGAEPDEWIVSYATPGKEPATKSFTGHTVVLSGLDPDTQYDITLQDPSDVHLSGPTTITGQTLASVNITGVVAELSKSTALITWEFEGAAPASWNITTTGSKGYTNNQTVQENMLVLEDLVGGETYSLIITCDNMINGASTSFTPDALTITEITATATEDGNMEIAWSCEAVSDDVEWMVVYTMVGNDAMTAVEQTTEQTVTLTSLIPGSTYSVEIREASGEQVGGENITQIQVPAAESFTEHGFSKGYVVMYLRPDKEDWTINDLQYHRTSFSSAERVAFACQTTSALKDSDDPITILLVVRNANGSVVDHYTGEETWNHMWTRDTYVGELLRTPSEPGTYTLELYFNGKRVKTDQDIGFTIN